MRESGNGAGPKPSVFDRARATLHRLLHRRRLAPICDAASLRTFLQTRSSYVAQMTLYGYLRTRAGVRFVELFNDDLFVTSLNIAKWHVWLACLSDLSVYAGGQLRGGGTATDVGGLVRRLVDEILQETGTPADAGPEFAAHSDQVRARLALCDWAYQEDGAGPFTESPSALVHWAPIVEDLKMLDAEIVRNSVRFRWQEIRQQLRTSLDAASVVASIAGGARRDHGDHPKAGA